MDDQFLQALAATVLVETAVLFAWFHLRTAERKPSASRILFAGLLASSWSLPYFWYLLPRILSGRGYLPVGELLVAAGEAAVFRFVLEPRWARCVVLSLLCNLVSFAVGLALMQAWG